MGDLADDIYDRFVADRFGDLDDEWGGAQPSRGVVCKHCEKAGLRWHQQQHWALVEPSGALHQCRKQTAAEVFSQA